ncbi:hypothetical protein EVAR_64559_1 [Eumeta japonica]|uniref:Uncharacterized protein n=1 Tax=Eumeta variegata TaxID=151549 RepID=A0A4C1ZCM7_EUMVA|nr:hypothetical protein EVAR_64559_1 [Eumeta japonica]
MIPTAIPFSALILMTIRLDFNSGYEGGGAGAGAAGRAASDMHFGMRFFYSDRRLSPPPSVPPVSSPRRPLARRTSSLAPPASRRQRASVCARWARIVLSHIAVSGYLRDGSRTGPGNVVEAFGVQVIPKAAMAGQVILRLTGPTFLWLQFETLASRCLIIIRIHPILSVVIYLYFQKLKEYLKRQRFEDDQAVVAAVENFLGFPTTNANSMNGSGSFPVARVLRSFSLRERPDFVVNNRHEFAAVRSRLRSQTVHAFLYTWPLALLIDNEM